MSTENQRFTIRASASRLEKGLLAIPQKFKDLFPAQEGKIAVVFDDAHRVGALTFHPCDPIVKENRIFGLGRWFSERGVREGDVISIAIEDPDRQLYRIALDRYVRERQEVRTRQNLRGAKTDLEADQELGALARITGKRPRELAQDELARIARDTLRRPRPRSFTGATERHEGVPSGTRVLLRELHEGKCQLCSFTFKKRSGEAYFEIHHLDPQIGHHPSNLLVVCPNCHAQLEHAKISDFRWAGAWLVGVTINGRPVGVRQPLSHDPLRRAMLVLGLIAAAVRIRGVPSRSS